MVTAPLRLKQSKTGEILMTTTDDNDDIIERELKIDEVVTKAREKFYHTVQGLEAKQTLVSPREGDNEILSQLIADALTITIGESGLKNDATLRIAAQLLQQGYFIGLFLAQQNRAELKPHDPVDIH